MNLIEYKNQVSNSNLSYQAKELKKTCYEKSAENIQKDVQKMILDGYESLCLGEIKLDNKKIWEDINCVIESLRKTV